MFLLLSWLTVAVVVASGIWYALKKRRHGVYRRASHLVVITADSQATIEWWVRSFMFWNWIRGKVCHCTCIDLGSTDDTLPILHRLQRRFCRVEIKRYHLEDRTKELEQLIPERLVQEGPVVLDLRQDPRRMRILLEP